MNFAALGEGQFALEASFFQIDPKGHQGQPTFGGAADQSVDFGSSQEQFSRAKRLVICVVAVRIRADVGVQQPYLAGFDDSIGVFQIDPAFSCRLDLSPGQYNSRFKLFDDFIVMKSLTIDRDVLHCLGGCPG